MKLKFIGKDGSMGLKHGNVYDVHILTTNVFVWVRWGSNAKDYCPYSSLAKLNENWTDAKE